jgi:uncharacterized SAM-binding protein YcdF (DUF218 family)
VSADSGDTDADPPQEPGTAGPAPAARRKSRLFRRRVFLRRRRLRRAILAALAALAALLVLFCTVTARLFIWPATGMPTRVDAIAVLGGPQSQQRADLGLRLAEEGRARYVLLSEGLSIDLVPGLCGSHRTFTVICWNPVPGTTQGEAEFVGQIARQHGWHSVVLVTTLDQAWRAQLRVTRCYPGQIYSVTTPLPLDQWPYQLAYQWAAAVRAEVLQRGC